MAGLHFYCVQDADHSFVYRPLSMFDGDLLVMFYFVGGYKYDGDDGAGLPVAYPTITPPTGWTLVHSGRGISSRFQSGADFWIRYAAGAVMTHRVTAGETSWSLPGAAPLSVKADAVDGNPSSFCLGLGFQGAADEVLPCGLEERGTDLAHPTSTPYAVHFDATPSRADSLVLSGAACATTDSPRPSGGMQRWAIQHSFVDNVCSQGIMFSGTNSFLADYPPNIPASVSLSVEIVPA